MEVKGQQGGQTEAIWTHLDQSKPPQKAPCPCGCPCPIGSGLSRRLQAHPGNQRPHSESFVEYTNTLVRNQFLLKKKGRAYAYERPCMGWIYYAWWFGGVLYASWPQSYHLWVTYFAVCCILCCPQLLHLPHRLLRQAWSFKI